MRRAWNLPDKRAVLASASNLMVCGVADIHPGFEGYLAKLSSTSQDGGVTASKKSGGGGKARARGSEKERSDRFHIGARRTSFTW